MRCLLLWQASGGSSRLAGGAGSFRRQNFETGAKRKPRGACHLHPCMQSSTTASAEAR